MVEKLTELLEPAAKVVRGYSKELVGFHYNTLTDQAEVHMTREAFHGTFPNYEVEPMGMGHADYHFTVVDGVRFFCLVYTKEETNE